MEVVDTLAEEGGVDSEGGSVGRGTHASSVEGRDTGPSTARDEVMPQWCSQIKAKRGYTGDGL